MNSKQEAILSVLYQCRILTMTQIHRLALYDVENKNGGLEYCKKIVSGMVKEGYIKKQKKGYLYLYSITVKGVRMINSNSIRRIGSSDERIEVTKTPAQISLADKNIPHQIAQNEFIMNVAEILNKADVTWWYSDDAFINKEFLGVFRPDGVLWINNQCYFLEMDMGTEQSKALRTKWQGYRKLFANGYINEKYGTVQVLFLIDGVADTNKRIQLVENTIQDIIPDLTNNQVMDIVIDTPTNLVEFMREEVYERILQTQFAQWKVDLAGKGYQFYDGKIIPTENAIFQIYCAQRDEKGVMVIDNNVEEYLVDDGRYHRQSVIYNTQQYRYNMLTLKATKGREIKYVILIEHDMYSKHLMDEVWNMDGVFLTTEDRFAKKQGTMRFFKQQGKVRYVFAKGYKIIRREDDDE